MGSGKNGGSGKLNVSACVVDRNGGSGKLSVDACTCTCICTRTSNVALSVMCLALPIVLGAWSMAVLLRQFFEYYYLFAESNGIIFTFPFYMWHVHKTQ